MLVIGNCVVNCVRELPTTKSQLLEYSIKARSSCSEENITHSQLGKLRDKARRQYESILFIFDIRLVNKVIHCMH